MATVLLIGKADFAAANLVKFSQNIREDQINPFIYAAQEYDLEPRLGATLYDALEAIKGAPDPERPELTAFLTGPVSRYLALSAYHRFIAQHGLNVTQFGLTKTADPQGTLEQSSGQERAIIMRQVAADQGVALIKMTSGPFAFDGVAYSIATGGTAQPQTIRAPKRRTISSYPGYNPFGLIQ